MADETDKTAKTAKSERHKHQRGLTPKKLQFLQLVAAGHSVHASANMCQLSLRQGYRWRDELDKYMKEAEIPQVEVALDAVQAMVPDAVAAYKRNVRNKDGKISHAPATQLLVSQRILIDRKTIESDANKSTDKLKDELGSIVERAQAIADKRSDEAYPVRSDSEGT